MGTRGAWAARPREQLAFTLGFVGAVALHWLGNFPLSLMAWNVGGMDKKVWPILIQAWLLVYFVAAVALLSGFAFSRIPKLNRFYGRRHCAEYQGDYDPPLFALNLGPTRYKRCPHCKHWHWTKTPDT